MAQPLREAIWLCLLKFQTHMPCDLAVPLLGILELDPHIYELTKMLFITECILIN